MAENKSFSLFKKSSPAKNIEEEAPDFDET